MSLARPARITVIGAGWSRVVVAGMAPTAPAPQPEGRDRGHRRPHRPYYKPDEPGDAQVGLKAVARLDAMYRSVLSDAAEATRL